MNSKQPFKWRHFLPEVILMCVRWYLRYPLSYRDLEEMMLDRGLEVDHTTIYRWVQSYSKEFDKRVRSYLKQTNDSWRVDETYIKVKGEWKYLYRAVDSNGNTLDFMFSPTRNANAAKRFLSKVLKSEHNQKPRVINVDKNPAYPITFNSMVEDNLLPEDCELRQNKYLNNIVEQDHRFIKKLVKPTMGFQSFHTARRTLQGYEAMNVVRKGQVKGIEKGNILGQIKFIHSLFGVAA